jgi:hypothetical protein
VLDDTQVVRLPRPQVGVPPLPCEVQAQRKLTHDKTRWSLRRSFQTTNAAHAFVDNTIKKHHTLGVRHPYLYRIVVWVDENGEDRLLSENRTK